ncbi:LCP family protein [Actinoplanes sp. NPDC049118]|uniref:LCP family protein n=1 Tax=Actinoplanes sp. NPDC049118 TaxID=3155769 RepID=UPI0034016CFE
MPGTVTDGTRRSAPDGLRGQQDVPPGTRGRRRPHRAPLCARLITAAGAVLMLVGVGGIVAVRYFLDRLTGNIQTTSSVLGETAAGGAPAGRLPEGAMNLLLLGLDTRQGWEAKGEISRSDTILVLHITASHDQAYMISIPRDMIAEIPADRSIGFGGSTEKINSAYAYGSMNGRGWTGGAKLATRAVQKLTGIGFDGVVVIDFEGFRGILEAMGGVHMCVDKDSWSSHYTVDSNGRVRYAVGADPTSPPRNALWFRKGCRNMAAWEALEFSRLRHSTNGDYDRQRHQQQLLRAMARKATSAGILTNPAKVSGVMAAAGSSLRMDTHGVPVDDFIFGLKGLAAADLIPIRTNGGTFAAATGGGEGATELTRALFRAAVDDRLGEFLVDHPELVISDGGPL